MTTIPRTGRLLAALVLLGAGPALTGCSAFEIVEHMCSPGEFPTYAAANPAGGVCVKDGHRPPQGMYAYPPQRVPDVVGDRYDRWPPARDYPWRDEVDPAILAQAPAWTQRGHRAGHGSGHESGH